MFDKKPNSWFVLAAFIAIGGAVVAGIFAYNEFVASSGGSLSSMRAERKDLEESKVRLIAETAAVREQLEISKRELASVRAKLNSYQGQIQKVERDKQTAQALLQLKAEFQNGSKKGTYIDASYVGLGQNSIKVSLKNTDGNLPALPREHPDSEQLYKIISGLENLQSMTIRGLNLNRRGLEVIRNGASIGYLELADVGLTDESCKDLLEGKTLWGLNLAHNPITVVPACQAEKLVILDLQDTRIDDEEVRRIAHRFPKIQHLNLTKTKVTDAGISSLASLVNLKFLEFCDVNVGDAGVEPLSTLKNLKTLRIDKTKVSDSGLRFVSAMDDLDTVYVRGTGIADEGLNSLSRRPKLHRINVEQTQITDNGLVEFCKQVNDRAEKSGDFTIMIDRQGRREDIVDLLHQAGPKISVECLKE